MKRVLTLKTIFFFLLIQFAFIGEWTIHAASFGNESLNYTISYKWGVIHKDAANATLSCREDGNNYKFFLTAKTLPWADSYFQVRDTLTSIVSKDGFKVQKYIKEAHEGEHYSKDIVDFKYAGSVVKGTTTRLRKKNNEPIRKSGTSLTAGGPTFDMLSVFYFLRTLDYQNMTPKKITKVNI
ncbi:MAG: DUF3108 domain-containing protein, partial [Muribaculaceae bacterium]|nr:DUF3108 domain-containing protein [Muribaculaceae bacterium]